jgi:hypothetical protein
MTAVEILSLTVSFLAAAAAGAAAIYAGRANEKAASANNIATSSLRFQVLVPALTEYRTAEMHFAVRNLWHFYKEDPETLIARFQKKFLEDEKRAAELGPEKASEFLRTTINFQRRQVSQFYGLLTSIYDEGGDQRKWLYTYWQERELRIIPLILVPLTAALAESIDATLPDISVARLNRLYHDSPRKGAA